jgi:hypothetical protein
MSLTVEVAARKVQDFHAKNVILKVHAQVSVALCSGTEKERLKCRPRA